MGKAQEEISEKYFSVWLTRTPRRLTGLVTAILYVLIVLTKNIFEVKLSQFLPEYNEHKVFYNSLPSLIEGLVLVSPLLWCFRVVPPKWSKDEVANEASIQFARCLAGLIAAWIIFYLLNFIALNRWIVGLGPWIDLCNNMQGVFLFGAYWTLTAITIPGQKKQNKKQQKEQNGILSFFWAVIKKRQKKRAGWDRTVSLPLIFSLSLWAVTIFHFADLTLHFSNYRFWFQLLSGLAVGVCMALVVGCLESEYFETPPILTAWLYCYSVLQLAYIGFNLPDEFSMAVSEQWPLQLFSTLFSLPLKLLFIGLCYWHIQRGRLPFYMEKTREILTNVRQQWDDFRYGNFGP